MTDSTSTTAADFADAAADFGDEAVRESIGQATPKPRFPPGYTMKKDGLHLDDEGLIASPFEVIAQTRDKNGNAWGKLLRWNDDDGQPHQVAVANGMLAGDGTEVRRMLMDGGLMIAPGRKRREALLTFLLTVRTDRRARAVTKVGWQDGAFALPDRTIEAQGGQLVVYQGTAALDHQYREAGALEDWQQSVARFGIGNSRIALAISAAFVGPLLATVGEEGGGIHLRGASSIGKSTALLAAASIWGPPEFVRQWRATQNGLEGLAEQANETLLILDELAQLDEREAGSVAYLLANGTGKSRASQTGEARAAKRWVTFFLSSGEISLADHARSSGQNKRSPAGQEVRILDIDADAGKGLGLFDTIGSYASGEVLSREIKAGAAQFYGVAGPAFVRKLIGQLDLVATIVRRGIDAFVAANLPPDANGQVARSCRRFGLIAAAGEVAAKLGILPWREGVATEAATQVFASWLDARGGAGAAEDGATIDQIRDFLVTHGQSRFQSVSGEGQTIVHNRAGFWRADAGGNREYIIPASSWPEVCRGAPGGPKTVSALLLRRGHLSAGNDGKASVSMTVPGMPKTRCYVVNASLFEDSAHA